MYDVFYTSRATIYISLNKVGSVANAGNIRVIVISKDMVSVLQHLGDTKHIQWTNHGTTEAAYTISGTSQSARRSELIIEIPPVSLKKVSAKL